MSQNFTLMPPKRKHPLGNDGMQPHNGGRVLSTQMQTIIQSFVHSQRFSITLLTATATNRLLPMHITTAAGGNWNAWGRNYTNICSNLSKERTDMLVFVKANMALASFDVVGC